MLSPITHPIIPQKSLMIYTMKKYPKCYEAIDKKCDIFVNNIIIKRMYSIFHKDGFGNGLLSTNLSNLGEININRISHSIVQP